MGAYDGVGARRARICIHDSANVYRVRLPSSFQSVHDPEPCHVNQKLSGHDGFLGPTWRTLTPCGSFKLAAGRRQVV